MKIDISNLTHSNWRYFCLKHLSHRDLTNSLNHVAMCAQYSLPKEGYGATQLRAILQQVINFVADHYKANHRCVEYDPLGLYLSYYPDAVRPYLTELEKQNTSFADFIATEIQTRPSDLYKSGYAPLIVRYAISGQKLFLRYLFDHGIMDGIEMGEIATMYAKQLVSFGLTCDPLRADFSFVCGNRLYKVQTFMENPNDRQSYLDWVFRLTQGSQISAYQLVSIPDNWWQRVTLLPFSKRASRAKFKTINKSKIQFYKRIPLNYHSILMFLHRIVPLLNSFYSYSTRNATLAAKALQMVLLKKIIFSKMIIPDGYIVFMVAHPFQKFAYIIASQPGRTCVFSHELI